jgi:3-oxoacyl-[acyl-carrier-protein] synthase-3
VSLTDLHKQGKLRSTPETLEALGWRHAHVAGGETAADLADRAVEAILAQGIRPDDIDALIYCGATVHSFVATGSLPAPDQFWDFFRYPANRLQDRWGLTKAAVFPLAQQGCTTLLAAIRLARDMIRAEPEVSRVLCVSVDVLPAQSPREAIFNLLSDGSCAVVVERGCTRNEIVLTRQVAKGYYWDPEALQVELMAAYFPTARHVLLRTLEDAGIRREDVRWLVPQNVSFQSWRILLSLLQWPLDVLYKDNISDKGHTIAADTVINLKDILDRGLVARGEYLILFSFGFGANWTAILVRH